ncbi:MAG: hypothetical protein RLY50_377, partial [Actinomycetota bacterium]
NSTGGTAYGWGRNTGRQASTGTATTGMITPTAVTGVGGTAVTDVVAVSAGASHSVAIRADGSLLTWGSDLYGQLGDGTTSGGYVASPTLPPGRIAVQAIAAGGYTMARLDDGSIVGFGLNRRGVLGNGNATNQISPVAVLGGHAFVDFDTSGNLRNTATPAAVAVTEDGDVYAWGANDYGQVGRGVSASSTSYSTAPVAVLESSGSTVAGVDAVAAGSTWSAAYGRFEPLVAPEPPTGVSATAGDASVTLSWTAPSPFREVSAYEITVSDGSSTSLVAAGGGVTTKTIAGLANGTSYSFTLQSINRVGRSNATSAVAATPSTIPGEPFGLVANPAAGSITMSWAPPLTDGGSAVLDYTARVFANGDDPGVDAPIATATVSDNMATFSTSDGLVNGTAYDVYVSARNANGSSATSASVTAVVPGRPSPPRAVTASGLPSTARVTWSVPIADGGAPIVSDVVSAYSVPGNSLIDRVVVDSSTFSDASLALSDGTTYEVTVAASQDGSSSDIPAAVAAMGTESARVTVVAGRPSPPAAPVVSPSNGALVVTWVPVADVPGVTVTHYKVKAVAGSTVTSPALTLAEAQCADTCSYTLGSLTNGTSYDISVAAAVGATDSDFGLFGASTSATPRTVPGTPANMVAESGDRQIDVAWEPPASDGGSSLTGYTVTATAGSDTITSTVGPSTLAASLAGLTNGTTYTVSVVATNVAGDSATPATTTTKAYTVPSAPTVTAIGPATSTLATTKKASDGDTATLTFASATNLVAGNVVDVAGLGAEFDGEDIEISEVTTTSPFTITYAARTPDLVAEIAAVGTVKLAGIYLAWDAPDDGGDSITAYNVSVTDGSTAATYVVASGSVRLSNDANATGATTSSCPFASRTCTISKIESLDENENAVNVLFSNGSTYVVSISATNSAGTGASEAPSIVVGQPDEPTGVDLVADEGSFVACWADPARIPSGRSINSYRITAVRGAVTRTKTVLTEDVDASTACQSPKVGVVVDEFDDGTSPARGLTYSVSVSASVSADDVAPVFGAVSALATVVPLGVPDAPTLASVVVVDTSATVSWTAPANTGGQSITGYEVTSSPVGFGCVTTQLTCAVTGLSRGVSYIFTIVANNPSGASSGVSSQAVAVATTTTTTTAPAPPTAVTPAPTTVPPSTTTAVPVKAASVVLWRQSSVRGAIGGKVITASKAGATATYTVKSRTATLWFRASRTGGKATIKVNGRTRRTVDLYSSKTKWLKVTVTAPTKTAKSSKVSVVVSKSKNKKSKGTAVVLDAVSPSTKCTKGCIKNPSPPKS